MHKNKSQPELADIFRKYGDRLSTVATSCLLSSLKQCITSKSAAQLCLGDILKRVITVVLKRMLTIHAETGIVRNARHLSRKSGWMPGSLNCCPVHIFTTCLLCPMSSTLSF